jgi:hypothetical protein
MAQHTAPGSSRARGMLANVNHHRGSVRVLGNLEGMIYAANFRIARHLGQTHFERQAAEEKGCREDW